MNPSDGHSEGIDGTHLAFYEKLTPSFGIWLLIWLMTISLGIAYGRAYGLVAGVAVAILSTGAVTALVSYTTPSIQVDDLVFRAGRARLPLRYVGEVQVLDRIQTRESLHTKAHHRAYFLTKGWIQQSVIVLNTDEGDPHPYWQVSSRKADALSEALNRARMNS